MRMWMIDPATMCSKHILGEHGEIHKFRHTFVKQYKITGRIFPVVQIEPSNMEYRHNQLVEEMLERGMNHNSPYTQPDISYLGRHGAVRASISANIKELHARCTACKERYRQVISERYGQTITEYGQHIHNKECTA